MTATLTGPVHSDEGSDRDRLVLHRELAAVGAEADGLRADLDAVLAEVDALRADRDRLRADLQAVLADRAEVLADREVIRADRDAVRQDRAAVAADLERLRTDRDAVVADREVVRASLDALVVDREAVAADRDALVMDRAALVAERDAVLAAHDVLVADSEAVRADLQREIDRQLELSGLQAEELQRRARSAERVLARRRTAAAAEYEHGLREQSWRRSTAARQDERRLLREWAEGVARARAAERGRADHLETELERTRLTVSWRVTRSLRAVRRISAALGIARPPRTGPATIRTAPVEPIPDLPLTADDVALDLDHYRAVHTDLADLAESDLVAHYLRHGLPEGRPGSSWLRRCLLGSGLDTDDRERVVVVLPDGDPHGDAALGLHLIRELGAWYHVVTVQQQDGELAWQVADLSGTTVVLDDSRDLGDPEAVQLARELKVLAAPRFAVTLSVDCHRLATSLEAAGVPVVALVPEVPSTIGRGGGLDWFWTSVSEVVHPSTTVAAAVTARFFTARGRGHTIADPGPVDLPMTGLTPPGQDLTDYAELVDRLGRQAARVRSRQEDELRTILAPDGFDADFHAGTTPVADREGLARRYLQLVHAAAPLNRPHSGILVQRPRPGFHPLAYAESAPGFADTGGDPFAHYLAAGRPAGRWARRVITPQADTARGDQRLEVLVHGHFHYPELLPDLLDRLHGNRFRHTLALTTTTTRAADELARIAADHPAGAAAEVLLVPNRGRNLSALLSGPIAERLRSADVVLHVHGKRSPHLDGSSVVSGATICGPIWSVTVSRSPTRWWRNSRRHRPSGWWRRRSGSCTSGTPTGISPRT